MKGLLLRLSALVSDAEAAVRVIAYFDRPPGVGSGGRSVRQTRVIRRVSGRATAPSDRRAPAS
ncbi:MAG: hypothetical protein QOD96_1049 [Pseudonocardiales bacterium]|nr:hypothetical protein [Pseudonocardiales bacterium]